MTIAATVIAKEMQIKMTDRGRRSKELRISAPHLAAHLAIMFATISGGQVGVSVVGMIAGHGMRLRRGKAKKIAAAISRSPTAGMSNGVGTSPRHRSPKPPIATINAEIRAIGAKFFEFSHAPILPDGPYRPQKVCDQSLRLLALLRTSPRFRIMDRSGACGPLVGSS